MADKARSNNNRGPIVSSVSPTEDHTIATARPHTSSDFDRGSSKEDKQNSMLLMAALILDQGVYGPLTAHQTAIQRALEHYQAEIIAANQISETATIAAHEADPSNYDAGISFTGRGEAGVPSASGGRSTVAFGNMGRITVGEKQNNVNDVLADAARVNGINIATMRGMWHVESKFSSIREVSSTGCSGPWQFTQGTWAEMILKHGDKIAARLDAQGHTEDAAIALRYHNALVNREIRVNDAGLQSQRFNGHISTYAAAHYMADISRRQGLDAMNVRDGGKIYAAYNVGETAMRTLQRLERSGSDSNAMQVVGRVARLNPMFYQGGANGAEALANYQAAVENGTRQFSRVFSDTPALTQTAENRRAPASPQAERREAASTPVLSHVFGNAHDAIRVPAPAARALDHAADMARDVVTRGQQMFARLELNNPFSS